MSAVIIDEKVVHYEVLGRGKPIIFLHGWVGSWRYWIPAMQAASTSYRAYAMDLWGFGETAKDVNTYSLEQQTDLLDKFMNAMGIGKVALVGHGLGAAVALLFASKHAFVVDRAMAISMPVNGEGLTERVGSTLPADLANKLLSPKATADTARSEAVKADEAAIQTSLKDLELLNFLEVSEQISTASLIVHGLNDPVIQTPNLGENGSLSSMFHHIIFEDSGHFPMLDQPNKFNRLMNDFLNLASGESPSRLQIKEEWKRRVR